MEVKTYRARSLQDALQLIRSDLGSDAAVLHTRELRGGWLSRLMGHRQVEVTASATVNVPSRFAEPAPVLVADQRASSAGTDTATIARPNRIPPADEHDYRAKFRDDLKCQLNSLQSMVEDLCRKQGGSAVTSSPNRCSYCSPI